jgi:predicted RNase H-related nuclease YkuK (DUF458 family)
MTLPVLNLDEVKDYIKSTSPETIIYIGVDSERFKLDGVWWVDYMKCVVVHIDGNSGGHVFGGVDRERDYDTKPGKPALRLMNEVYKASELYLSLADVLEDRLAEVHLDINPNIRYGSNCVAQQAIGYIKGTTNMTPKIKPFGFAASFAADKLKFILANQKEIKDRIPA